ncbi:MAG: sugar ABC transporter substrate-binding protein [Lachnospiraceae bacterium]|uniref:Substrate-binding domain-containing protein n=1 Tax=Candidatus Weimeria bifida TaxID=2599074 RepID=A0A6N7IYQ4_9FIRM|nr:substrate-binding domain-containing protein [Candidatus Weimeria bifida]RRF95773.1 MAG: sugar ABC transporter substrate-binding protein [Lachnospiraceae bacterium]
MKKHLLKKITAFVGMAAMSVGLLSGCGSSSGKSASGGSGKIMLIGTDKKDAYRKSLMDAILSEAKKAGVTIDDREVGEDVEKQAEAARNAASGGYSAIICRLADASTAPQIELAAGGLPVIYVNNQPDESALKADKYMYVASDESQCGKLQAEYVIKKLGKKEMNVVILEGEKGHSATIQRTLANKNTFKRDGIKVNIVFEDYCDWLDTEARHKLDLFFKSGKSVDAILSNNDTMALGAIQALEDNGLDPKKIPVTGVDATSDGCKSISQGKMSFTVFQNAKGQAAKAVEIAKTLGSGKSAKGIKGVTDNRLYGWVPFEPVDSSNVSKYMS